MNGQKTALVTGASGGIGFELAEQLASNGYNLILIARSKEKMKKIKEELEEKYGVSVEIIVKDLAQLEAPKEIFDRLKENGVTVDVLVNNAGVGYHGFFHEIEIEKHFNIIDLNIKTPVYLMRLFLPEMIKRKD